MKQAALSLLLITFSALCVKEEEPSQRPDLTCKTGKLVIKNDEGNLLVIYINTGTEKASSVILKQNESIQFKTDECNEQITLELMLLGIKKRIILKGQSLGDNHTSMVPISFLYAGS